MALNQTFWGESTLCDKCSIIRFDDSAWGGYETKDEKGRPFLNFINDDNPSWTHLRLNYFHTDTLPDLPLLKASSEAGCAFCGALRDATLARKLHRPGYHVDYRLQYLWQNRSCSNSGLCKLQALFRVYQDEDDCQARRTYCATFHVESEDDTCIDWLRTTKSPQEHPLCDPNIAWIKEELSTCDVDRPLSTSTFTPTRLLHLGPNENDIRLIQTSETRLYGPVRYAALSYCWGPEHDATQQLQLNAATLSHHLEHIHFEAMTPVIQDAVKTARALSIQYLWIDALCILQGDIEDWTRESERMGLVYANAHVTICAVKSASCMQGFLDRSRPLLRISFQSNLRRQIRGMLNLVVGRPLGGGYHEHRQVIDGSNHWGSRAWTLQEQQLSSRILYFGFLRIHFSCPRREVTEAWNGASVNYQHFSHDLQNYNTDQSFEGLYDLWNRLFPEYAGRQATDTRDRFPALSGLAGLMAMKTGDVYLAGLWEKDLLRGLLWRAFDKDSTKTWDCLTERFARSFSTYICPSWSWAHYTNVFLPRLTWHNGTSDARDTKCYHGLRPETRFLAAWCTPESNSNPYGRIRNGELRVEGKVLQLSMTTGSYSDKTRTYRARHEGIELEYELFHDIRIAAEDLEAVYMLLLASTCPDSSQEESCPLRTAGEGKAWGLLIRPFIHGQKFVRVGSFESRWKAQTGLLPFENLPFQEVMIV